MSILVTDCPRCRASRITLDVLAQQWCGKSYDWMNHYEIFCTCRNCHRGTTFVVSDKAVTDGREFASVDNSLVKYTDSLNKHFTVDRFISIRDL